MTQETEDSPLKNMIKKASPMMNPQLRKCLLVVAFLAFATSFGIAEEFQGDGALALIGGTLIDATGALPILNATFSIQDTKVQAIRLMDTIVAATKVGALVLGLGSWIQVSNIFGPLVIFFLECQQCGSHA